jgi:hypothetical protein
LTGALSPRFVIEGRSSLILISSSLNGGRWN